MDNILLVMFILRDDGRGRGCSGGEVVGFEAIPCMGKKVLLAFGG